MFMIKGWDNLVSGVNGLVYGLFGELLRDCGLSSMSGVDLHNVEIQLLSSFEEGSVLDCGSHASNPYRAYWFPRCHSFSVDDYGGRECAHHPIGVSIRHRKSRITKNEVIRSHVGNIELKKMGGFFGDNF